MANEWNTAYPIDHTKIGDVPGAIRTLKDSVKDQLDREHETPADGDATGSEHSNGSAVCYISSTTPTNRPNGSTPLADNNIDNGRLWIDETATPVTLKRWKTSAFAEIKTLGGWTPTTYEGGESVITPIGLILKHGIANFSAGAVTITFAAAFPTGVVSVSATPYDEATTVEADYMAVTAVSASAMTVKTRNNLFTSVYWQAWGY